MKKNILLLLMGFLIGCTSNPKTDEKIEQPLNQETESSKSVENFEISFEKSKVSDFTIESIEDLSGKAMVKRLSEYSTTELQALPICKKLVYSIIVPTFISKESLENTLKYFVSKKTSADRDIDEIMVFAYDDKNDIGIAGYTFGRLIWAPHGKFGNVTPVIATKNIRDNYRFEIDIKEKVGNISKGDIPTKRELEIYNMIMADEYLDMSEDNKNKMIMKKFNIKSAEEVENIFLKVAVYKYN